MRFTWQNYSTLIETEIKLTLTLLPAEDWQKHSILIEIKIKLTLNLLPAEDWQKHSILVEIEVKRHSVCDQPKTDMASMRLTGF